MADTIAGKLPSITDQAHVADAYSKQAGTRLRVALATVDMSQTDLAARLHVSQQWVARRIKGDAPITLPDVARIALVLDVPRTTLIPE